MRILKKDVIYKTMEMLSILLALFAVFLSQVSAAVISPFAAGSPLFSTSSQLDNLLVKCDKTGMLVSLSFTQPFPGSIYSLGYQANPSCKYVNESASSTASVFTFFIPIGRCGTEGRYTEPRPGEKVIVKNTIVIQHDPDFLTAEDSAHALSCTWADTYIKQVTSKPVQVEDDGKKVMTVVLDPISVQSGNVIDRFQTNLASGVLQMDKEKNVIINVVDPLNQYDAMVLDCMAFDIDGGNAVALTDKNGCLVQLSLMPPFKKVRNVGSSLTLHSTLKDYRLTQVKNLRIKCNVEVCPGQCRVPCQIATSDVNTRL